MVLSAAMTCVGGVLYAQYQLYVNPDNLSGIGVSLQMVFGVVAGGMFVLLGPTVGAVFLLLLSEGLRLLIGNDLHGLDLMIYGALLVVFIIFMPKGILGSVLDLVDRRRSATPARDTLPLRATSESLP
jgi:branched-chain amino acid transport system permease protein